MKLFKKEKNGSHRTLHVLGFKIKYIKNKSYKKYFSVYNKAGFELYRDEKYINIKKNDFWIQGLSDNTLWTGESVLCQEDYNFNCNEPYTMIDIGFNLGMSSLWAAQNKNIKEIYGFEPFEPTRLLAQNNLEHNTELAKKIKLFPFGLGAKNEEIKINYEPNSPGAMSSVKNRFEDAKAIETIQIKNAAETLQPIFNKTRTKIFMKIDCEGAEFEILPDLDNSGLLKKINVIIMEWHFQDPKPLIEILEKNGFCVFCNNFQKNEIGMIRAVKIN